ncbi:MAG: hypothetical protein GDA46_01190 [Bdellovibrionales bacterium]|nr:hypothetical protein [Bdellovibrionales bacterium]
MNPKGLLNKPDSLSVIESIYKISLGLKDNSSLIPQIIEDLKRVLNSAHKNQTSIKTVNYIERFSSKGQFKSKLWLIQKLKKIEFFELGQVFLCAGWCGTLAYLLFQEKTLKVKQIFNFDKDPLSITISEDLNRKWVKENWKFKATLKDILDLNYHSAQFNTLKKDGSSQELFVSPDTIINTSCEHIENFTNWWKKIPKGKKMILQSNNFYEDPEHINCVSSLKHFKNQAPLSQILFKGELNLGKYSRFMLIGNK